MSLNNWFQHLFYRNLATATHCCLICQDQLLAFAACDEFCDPSHYKLATTWNQHWSSYIGCQSNRELLSSCVCSCTLSTSDKHHNTCHPMYPQFLQPVADTSWGWLAQRFTFCQEQELNLENVVSSTPVYLPRSLFHLTFMTLVTPVYSEND